MVIYLTFFVAFLTKNMNRQDDFTNKLSTVSRLVNHGLYAVALNKLQDDILRKIDGCTVKNRPDMNDWITDCSGQDEVYPMVIEVISLQQELI